MGGQRACWRLILIAEKLCFVAIGERTWDNGGHVHERGFSRCTDAFTARLAAWRRPHEEIEGGRECPPFRCSNRARGCGATYICAASPGRIAPVLLIPEDCFYKFRKLFIIKEI